MKWCLFVAVAASGVAQQAEEDNTMLQIGEHIKGKDQLGVRPRAKGRIALHSFCQNFCKVNEDHCLTFNRRGNVVNVCERKKRFCVEKDAERMAPGFGYSCERDEDYQSCNIRNDMCAFACRERNAHGNGFGAGEDTCSRRAGLNNHLCDQFGQDNMDMVLRRHCGKTCKKRLCSDTRNENNCKTDREEELCVEVCDGPDEEGRYDLRSGAALEACAGVTWNAWRCQTRECGDLVRELEGDTGGRCRNKQDRYHNRCRRFSNNGEGGDVWNEFEQCVHTECATSNGPHGNDLTLTIRHHFQEDCEVEDDDPNELLRVECLRNKTRDVLVGNADIDWFDIITA